jgi:hypothetical protein
MSLLPKVLDEICQRLVANDWFKMISDDGKSYYYVIGAESHGAEVAHEVRFKNATRGYPLVRTGLQSVPSVNLRQDPR